MVRTRCDERGAGNTQAGHGGARCFFCLSRPLRGRERWRLSAPVEDVVGVGILHDRPRDVGQTLLSSAGVRPHQEERLLHADRTSLGKNTLRLLDDHPGSQSGLQLLVDHICLSRGALMQNPHRRDVGQCLTDRDIG